MAVPLELIFTQKTTHGNYSEKELDRNESLCFHAPII